MILEKNQYQFLGTLDVLGRMNSRSIGGDIARKTPIPGVWHSLNTRLPGHMDVKRLLEEKVIPNLQLSPRHRCSSRRQRETNRWRPHSRRWRATIEPLSQSDRVIGLGILPFGSFGLKGGASDQQPPDRRRSRWEGHGAHGNGTKERARLMNRRNSLTGSTARCQVVFLLSGLALISDAVTSRVGGKARDSLPAGDRPYLH